MSNQEFPEEFLRLLEAVTGRRARIVVEHILKHGFITTEDLERTYGYRHPPRAVRDVREQGIPLETFQVKNAEGRTIAAYRFGKIAEARQDRVGGRRTFSKVFKTQLYRSTGGRCSICHEDYEARYLQVDHRVPYEVAGDALASRNLDDYMLVCGSCNRAKSWSCEHCENWLKIKNPEICLNCYWANPDSYTHIALRLIRRLDITWAENEVGQYEQLKQLAEFVNEPLPDYVKNILRKHLTQLK